MSQGSTDKSRINWQVPSLYQPYPGSTDESHHCINRMDHIEAQLMHPITVSTVLTVPRFNWRVPSPYQPYRPYWGSTDESQHRINCLDAQLMSPITVSSIDIVYKNSKRYMLQDWFHLIGDSLLWSNIGFGEGGLPKKSLRTVSWHLVHTSHWDLWWLILFLFSRKIQQIAVGVDLVLLVRKVDAILLGETFLLLINGLFFSKVLAQQSTSHLHLCDYLYHGSVLNSYLHQFCYLQQFSLFQYIGYLHQLVQIYQIDSSLLQIVFFRQFCPSTKWVAVFNSSSVSNNLSLQ